MTVATGTALSFGDFVARAQQAGRLVVQPRMGFSDPARMRAGLLATRRAAAATVGTVTLDSYTRVGDHARRPGARWRAGRGAQRLPDRRPTTCDAPAAVLDGVASADFPVQVRHGSAVPGADLRAR